MSEEKAAPQESIQTHQAVYNARLATYINIYLIAEVIKGHVSRFPAATVKMLIPECAPMIFRTGSINIMGTRHEWDALLAIYMLLDKLREVDVYPRLHGCKISNVVVNAHMGHFIDVSGIARDYSDRCNYQKDMFGGLHFIYKVMYMGNNTKKPRSTVVIIFYTGSIVITGGRDQEELRDCLRGMIPILRKYRLDTPQVPVAPRASSAARGTRRRATGDAGNSTRRKRHRPSLEQYRKQRAQDAKRIRGLNGVSPVEAPYLTPL